MASKCIGIASATARSRAVRAASSGDMLPTMPRPSRSGSRPLIGTRAMSGRSSPTAWTMRSSARLSPAWYSRHALELDDVADEPGPSSLAVAEGVAVLDADGVPGRHGGRPCTARPIGNPIRAPITRSLRDPGRGHQRHQRRRDDEHGIRGGVGDDRPGRKIEVVLVLVRREHGTDALQAAGIDRRLDQPIRSRRQERVDQHQVGVAPQGEPGLPERDDPDGTVRRTPRGQVETRTSAGRVT